MGHIDFRNVRGSLHRYRNANRKLRYHLNHFGWRGAAGWAVHTLFDWPFAMRVKLNELNSDVKIRFGNTDIAVFEQIFLKREYDLDIPPDEIRVIVDCGAYIGLSALYFRKKFPNATVLAVEADAENHALLCENVRADPDIVPIHAAIWHEPTVLEFDGTSDKHWGKRAIAVAGSRTELPDRTTRTVSTVTIDELMDRYGLAGIDILKLDVEGAEREVLNNCDTWIGKVGMLVAELHDRFAPGCAEAFEHAAAGFPVRATFGENKIARRS